MTVLPIVARELRVACRKRNTYLGRVVAAFVPITMAAFWVPAFAAQYNVAQGKILFTALSVLLFGYCLLAGAQVTSDCLSAEKREGTIGLLFLTDLRGYDIVLGKLVSCSLTAFYGLLATVPVLALAILLGGVTLGQLGRTALLFLNTLFFSLAAGVFVSALSQHDRRAMFATVCVLLLVLFAPYGLSFFYAWWQWTRSGRAPGGWDELATVVQISPLFAFRLLGANLASPSMIQSFYQSILATHLLGWALLAIASLVAPRVCRERVRGQLGIRWLLFRNRWSYGSPARRAAFRRRLLDRNAFFWLAARDRIKAHYVWLFVGALGLIWCWSGWLMGRFIPDWEVSFSLLFLCFVFIKVWLASEVCTRLVEDRASGAFELLLSSPLRIRDIAHGQSLALRRQFGRPVVAMLGLTLVLLSWALRSPHSGYTDGEIKLLFWVLMILFVADLVTLKWVGMWHAVTSPNVNRAALAACTRVLFLPTIVFILGYIFCILAMHATGPNPAGYGVMWKGCMLWLAIGLAADAFFGLRARWQFLHHFRGVASQRFSGPIPKLQPFREMAEAARSRVSQSRFFPSPAAVAGPYWKRWWVAGPALLLVCVVGGAALWKRSVHQRVDSALAAIRAKGEPVNAAALRSWRQAVVPQENAGILYQKAAIRMVTTRLPRRAVEWPEPDVPLEFQTWQFISNFVARNGIALELLHAGAKLPRSHYPIDWSYYMPPTTAIWQSLHALDSVPELLEFEAQLSIESGNPSRAVQSIRTLAGIARAMSEEPFLAAQTLRGRCLNSAVRVLERLLNRHPLPEQELAFLQNDLHQAGAATRQALQRAFIGERALQIDSFESRTRFGPPGWGSTWQKALSDALQSISEMLEIRNRLLLDFLAVSGQYVERASWLGTPQVDVLAGRAPLGEAGTAARSTAASFDGLTSYWDQFLVAQLEMVVRLRTVETALALERFRAANEGRLPQTLDALSPRFIDPVPADPFLPAPDETPLQFRRQDPGYLIYSVGADRADHGGVEPPLRGARAPKGETDIVFKVRR